MALAGNAKGGQRAKGVFGALEMVKILSFLITIIIKPVILENW